MKDHELYAQVLGIGRPWRVLEVELRREKSEVIVKIDHDGSSLRCPKCGMRAPGYDRLGRRWRHLDTCQYQTVIECAIPRVECPEHGVLQIPVPWAEPRSGFTTLMESRIIDWLDESSLSGVSRVQHVSWRKVDVVMARAVKRGLGRRGPVSPEGIGVDEKARSKGNEYVTIVTDLDEEEGKVLHIADGREKKALASFYEDIGPEACARIQVAAMDMSNAYVSATREYVPDADNKIAFDRFHVAQHLAKAVDQVRRAENKDLVATGDERLKRTRYLWLKNPENQTPKNLARFRKLEKTSLRTARAWRLKEIARFLWDPRPRMHALLDWAAWWIKARKSGLAPVRRVAETVRNHAWGIATAIHLGVTNARSESFNAAIQKISGRAHGFRSTPRFKTAIYFYLGGLDMHPRSAPST